MKYLDERIIANVTLNSPSLGDRLYRYDVAIDNEWNNPIFIGNCFIGANIPTKSIDITDIVRNYYDFSYPYQDTEFQREWQVKLYLDDTNTVLSDSIGIYPIYRYLNRKARMETPLSNNGLNWYMPALQGFNSDKKGEFLPHIPFVFSDKVDYNLALNIGNLSDANPYLNTGVKKELKTADFGIYNTQYKLSELWKGAEVETLDWNWQELYTEETTGVYTMKIESLSPLHYNCKLPLTPRQLRYSSDDGETFNIEQITEFPFVADIQGDIIQGSYLDVYIEKETDLNYANIYPAVDKDTTVKAHIVVDYQPVIDIDLVENVDGGTKSGNFVTVTTNDTTFNVIAEDAESGEVREETGLVSGKTFEWDDTEGIKTLKITTANGILCTISLADKSVADTGAEYLMQLQVAAGNLIISFLDQQYDADVTFRTYRVPVTPLTQDNITIQNDGTDNLSTVTKIGIGEERQNFEVMYGSQTFNYTIISGKRIPYGIRSQLTAPKWSYAVIDNNGKLISYADLTEETTPRYKYKSFALTENNIALYIFAISDTAYEVTKITSKDFGIVKGFGAQITSNATTSYYFMDGWNAALNNEYVYQQYVASKNIIEVAKVDNCPSRYYLQWRDRYGSCQCQPFSKAETYSEDFTRTEIKNYQDTRRLSGIGIQPKWKLNSAWIPFDLVPYYESLQVSPWVKLYDTKEDQLYDVILKDTAFTEKTFRNNDRQLWHMEIECEQTDKQNILY